MYELLGISIAFAALLTINALATLVAAGFGRLLRRPLRRCTARTRAEILFALRIAPPAIAIVTLGAFLIPSYLIYEPHATKERITIKLAVLAIASGIGVTLAVCRGLRSWIATRSLLRQWSANATRVEVESVSIPTFRLPHSFPLVAVIGSFRPKLFIADHVLRTLTEEELAAAIAHEYGHLAALDNFKRSLLRSSRSALLVIPCGRSLDRAWSEASESAADEYAAQESPTVAVNLAAALVTIARLVPQQHRTMLPTSVSTFLRGDEEPQGVKDRVRRLLELAATDSRSRFNNAPVVRFGLWLSLALIVIVSITIESRPQVLASVHALIEQFVAVLT
ncbi:MAG TPA: M56 family metallopeptidase [Pyrinomonadaceae bacterium]|nr:M56 family metallopeptidase [Pyrinomonadaceae bacterium]